MTIRESIKKAIRDKGLFQKHVAEKSGISTQQLYAMLNGYTKLTIEEFCKLCQFLEIEPNEILGYPWDNEPTAPATTEVQS
jgi:DNA-binding Xre family transcriptional regulator